MTIVIKRQKDLKVLGCMSTQDDFFHIQCNFNDLTLVEKFVSWCEIMKSFANILGGEYFVRHDFDG